MGHVGVGGVGGGSTSVLPSPPPDFGKRESDGGVRL